MTATTTLKTVLQAVQRHGGLMPPMLLGFLLRGETIARLGEKGLLRSPWFAALKGLPAGEVSAAIETCLVQGWVRKAAGPQAVLSTTPAGRQWLAAMALEPDGSPDYAFKRYHRWRQGVARSLRKPPYRIFPNAIIQHLATTRPTTLDDLLSIPGLGKRRALRYHEELLLVGRELSHA